MALLDTVKSLLGSAWHVNSDTSLAQLLPAADGTVEAGKVLVPDSNKRLDTLDVTALKVGGTSLTATGSEINTMAGILATTAELNRATDVSTRIVSLTTTPVTASIASHEGKTVVLNKADTLAVTLPAASGSGARFRFIVGIAASGGSYTIATAPTTDVFAGIALGTDDDGVPANSWATASNSNKITMDGSTQGGKVGDIVEIEDIAAGVWAITNMRLTQSDTEATPFSHV